MGRWWPRLHSWGGSGSGPGNPKSRDAGRIAGVGEARDKNMTTVTRTRPKKMRTLITENYKIPRNLQLQNPKYVKRKN